ncbi:MAG TPA: carboxypeptidase-like regulatory domain-containing protein, partial [Vicinamibacterales bacterium]|nr:carboxypeptidase-like regulatory domain-containing protein [Vicinamibacterales bacterium]
MIRRLLFAGVLAVAFAGGTAAKAATTGEQQRPQASSLRITVKDQTGAVVPGALVQIKGAEDKTSTVSINDLPSDGQGIVTVTDLVPGRYLVQVAFSGFETLVMPDLRVRAGENKRDAMLAIQKLDENISVGRDKATVASDPKNDRFSTVLSHDQINA